MFHHRLAIGLVLALGATAVVAQDVSGHYQVDGRNADGSAYSGSLTLFQENGMVQADWVVGGTTYSGYGPLEGRVLTIIWSPGQPPVTYVTMPDGTLHGTWADGYALERAFHVD